MWVFLQTLQVAAKGFWWVPAKFSGGLILNQKGQRGFSVV